MVDPSSFLHMQVITFRSARSASECQGRGVADQPYQEISCAQPWLTDDTIEPSLLATKLWLRSRPLVLLSFLLASEHSHAPWPKKNPWIIPTSLTMRSNPDRYQTLGLLREAGAANRWLSI